MTNLIDDIEPVDDRVAVVKFTGQDVDRLETLAFNLGLSPEVAIVELLRRSQPAQNGHGFQALCDHCGLPYTAFHQPKPGVKHYCSRPECKREAAAGRARRYRDRKTREAQK